MPPSSILRLIGRYGSVGLGPVLAALSQFVLSVVLLHGVSAQAFGASAVLLVASQFGQSLSSALLCAPFQASSPEGRDDAAFSSIDLALAVLTAATLSVVAVQLDLSFAEAALFALYALIGQLRWFARAVSYADGRTGVTVASDLIFGTTVLGCVSAMAVLGLVDLIWAFGSLLLSSLLATIPFGIGFLPDHVRRFSLRGVKNYLPIWRKLSSWSFFGVVTTEATVNAHAYIVAWVLGPSAFAPVAAAALLIRPVGLATNALSDYERARISRQVAGGDGTQARRAMRDLLMGLGIAWIVTALLAAAILLVLPSMIVPSGYNPSDFVIAAGLWLVVALVRAVRAPEGVYLQAIGNFRALAHATYTSCGVSMICVLVLTLQAGALWTVLGILLGEMVVAIMIHRAFRNLTLPSQDAAYAAKD